MREREEGSIVMVMLIALVATALVATTLVFAQSGLRDSRRSGDSANALQLADAGINDATRRASTVSGTVTCPDVSGIAFCDTRSLAGAGTYTFVARREASANIWHVTSTGVDESGMQRRLSAYIRPVSIFANALFGKSALQLAAGVAVDSYTDGTNASTRCSGNGIVGTDTGAQFDQTGNGNGNAVNNCGGSYPYDKCISYSDPAAPTDIPAQANCPTPIDRDPNPFPLPTVTAPSGTPSAQPANICSGGIPAGTYYWTSVTLTDGCRVNGAVKIFSSGPVTIGENGSNKRVNQPQPGQGGCPANPPVGYNISYCKGWPANLQIFVTNNSLVCFSGNNTQFWGTITAPQSLFQRCGGGGAHLEMFGALIFNSVDTQAQFSLHYDESLANLDSGTFGVRNWVEVASG